MTDVRLTATNPEDSSVVPVACNAKGELLLEDPTVNSDLYVAKAGDNMTGDLTLGTDDKITLDATDGSAEFAGGEAEINSNGQFRSKNGFLAYGSSINTTPFRITTSGSASSVGNVAVINNDGNAEFAGDVIVGSRNKKWMLVEQGGLCHMVEQLTATNASADYPPLRDVFSELNAIEAALSEVMEKLRMKPPAGWEVWDGSSENS